MPNQVMKVTVREVVERTFIVDEAAMCEDMLWPSDIDDSEICEVVEHSDHWTMDGDSSLKWLTEEKPVDAWREALDVRYEDPPASRVPTSRNEVKP